MRLDGVSKRFRVYRERNQTLKSIALRRRRSLHEDFWALRDVSFDIPQGSKFALIGPNGSGKSTLLKCIAQILYPDSGSVTSKGRLAALLEIGSGFHPELSGRDNVFLNAAILGMSKSQIRAKFDEIVDFSGVEQFIDQPVKTYSSGMYVRLAFAVAINVDPEILLLDEVLAVGDAMFQQKCMAKFKEFQNDGRTIVIVSHALPVLSSMCDYAAWLEKGRLQEVGATAGVLEHYADAHRSMARVTADGDVRWGTGDVLIDEVELLDRDGRTLHGSIRSGTPVTIRLHYTARERVASPLFSLAISASDGSVVWSGNTVDLSVAPCEVGSDYLDFVIPSLPLAGDDFTLTAVVHDKTTETMLDYRKDIQLRMKMHKASEAGYVALGGVWEQRVRVGEGV
ncbi:ABC transporter ATP-binding protein [Skermania sp. ID1734]|nr:ABC transporter ATP-binding protein [Skermania sp. ID1734]